jgi:hypothetical protein
MKSLQKISSAIKTNDAAKNASLPKEPLTEISPSSTSVGDGRKGIDFYRRTSRF